MSTWNPDKVRLDIARDLRAIEILYAAIWAEVLANADNPEIPGGDAMVMLGPHADPEAWSYFDLSLAMGRIDHHGEYELGADPVPPLLTLATWSDCIRKERGQDTALAASISRECAYIAKSVDWMLSSDADGNMNFLAVDDLCDDLRAMRDRMKNLLRIGDHHDKGAPCLSHGRRYVKVWDEDGAEPSNDLGYRWRCKGEKVEDQTRASGFRWLNSHWAEPDEYALANKQQARQYADKLTATDMEAEYRVRPSTLRKWVERGKVRKRGKDQSGRWLYDVADTLNAREVEDEPVEVSH